MTDKINLAQSLIWMLSRLKLRGQFSYAEWASEFRHGSPVKAAREDRTFHNHLKSFKNDALDIIRGDRDMSLRVENGNFSLNREINETKFEKFADPNAFNFLPLLHGLNNQNSLIPFAGDKIEKLLIDGYDLPDGTLDRVIYKTSAPWRFQSEMLNTFFGALASNTQVFVRPEPGRKPCHVTPLFVVNYDGAWYLFGLRESLLQYNLSRVEAIEPSDVRAEKVPREKVAQLRVSIQENFGINLITDWPELSRGEEATVRFRGWALRYARERFDPANRRNTMLWYRSEVTESSMDVTLRVQSWSELVSEVLRWGEDAEAVSPPEFREAWLDAARRLFDSIALK